MMNVFDIDSFLTCHRLFYLNVLNPKDTRRRQWYRSGNLSFYAICQREKGKKVRS